MMTPSDRTKAWKLAHPERTRELNRESVRRWKQRNPEKAKAATRQSVRLWKLRNPERVAYYGAVARTAYGLTLEQIRELEVAQCGECAICGVVPEKRLVIDHDHKTGKVRGLICSRCNIGLGHLGDDVAGVRRALAYLERVS